MALNNWLTAGLPEARDDHALVVARFARDCLHKMSDVTAKLEVSLGPDTTDLGWDDYAIGVTEWQIEYDEDSTC